MLYKDYLKKYPECPFCYRKNYIDQLISENETSTLIISLAPYQRHHLLITPKRHLEKILDITEKEMSDILKLQNLGIKILYGLNYKNMSILVREGERIGKSVRHLHYHIIPDIIVGAIKIKHEERVISTSEEIIKIREEINNILIL